jgi:hypothetical protein
MKKFSICWSKRFAKTKNKLAAKAVAGFKDFKLAVNDPAHEDYKVTREWAGLKNGKLWDANKADIETIVTISKYTGYK